jgi:hypothetical protein
MWLKLQEVFEELGLPYSRQGSYGVDEKLPSSFFTFWNKDSEFNGYYNNKPSRCVWTWNVFFYTNDPELIYSKLNDFVNIAMSKGFQVSGQGKDLQTDEPDYFGRYVEVSFIENLQQ